MTAPINEEPSDVLEFGRVRSPLTIPELPLRPPHLVRTSLEENLATLRQFMQDPLIHAVVTTAIERRLARPDNEVESPPPPPMLNNFVAELNWYAYYARRRMFIEDYNTQWFNELYSSEVLRFTDFDYTR